MTLPARPTTLPRWARTGAGASAGNVTVPSSGQSDTGWTVGQVGVSSYDNWAKQLYFDWLAQFAILLPAGVLSLSEGFEAGTFPPADPVGGWTAPSPRVGTLGWARSTTSPLAGTASASRPTGQAAGTVSSMGLDFYISSPSRVIFKFNVLCNPQSAANPDTFLFSVDGALNTVLANGSGTSGAPVAAKGVMMSDVLLPGKHTLDFSFSRGAGISVTGEACQVDDVFAVPESLWSDKATRFSLDDDFNGAFVASTPWVASNSGNAGTTANNSVTLAGASGELTVTSAAIAANDWQAVALNVPVANFAAGGQSKTPFIEALVNLPSLTNLVFELGLWDGTLNNRVCLYIDTSVSNAWGVRAVNGGAVTAGQSNFFASAGVSQRLGLTFSSLGVVGLIGGNTQANYNGNMGLIIPSGLPAGPLVPYVRIASIAAAGARQVLIDYIRVLSLR